MTSSKNIIRCVFSAATEHFKMVGFRKLKPGIFTRDLNEQIAGWVGLNTGPYQADAVSIGPFVGVRHHQLQSIVSDLLGLKRLPYTASIGTNVGYLSPEKSYRMWTFTFENLDEVVADMVSTIVEIGLPFMEQNADLAALCDTMCNCRIGIAHEKEYRIPVAYALLGRKADAQAYLAEKLREKAGATDMAASQYRGFANQLNLRMNQLNPYDDSCVEQF